ncbi:hypothetical protein [Levilactobacillus tujiorum]|uniref:TPR repeat-containing protein n=1 Tax=Levilactobacillus tujiorum TaxID=2912243 RepID=A0ABX1L4M2_9LACO|nr:hypothetical protein [Levilactobacillus tujiorum]MCH5464313.1 hypothetical protein [Levilactobacillus tujiorum]NLR11252.1 hypothetical protein [Lactobacillus sp. HBUAS51387]NLR29294.1 hypothetical protein [Levilactobacillus tujiorum]
MEGFSSPAAREAAAKKARQAFSTEDWSTAIDLFEKLYADQQTAEFNRYLVASLYHDEQYSVAEQYAAEQDLIYLESAATFQLRLDVALKNQQFIFAREFCELPAAQAWRDQGLNQIETAEQASRQSLGETQRVLAKQFYHLGDVSFAEQRQRLERARQLPLQEFMRGVQYLLVDPFLHPLMRATLLEELLRLHTTITVQVHWLDDQVHAVDTAKLKPVGTSLAAQKIQNYLHENLEQQDPMLMANISQTITLQLMMLYPFIDKIIQKPVTWVQVAAQQSVTDQADDAELEEINVWQDRLNRYMSALFGSIDDKNHEKP